MKKQSAFGIQLWKRPGQTGADGTQGRLGQHNRKRVGPTPGLHSLNGTEQNFLAVSELDCVDIYVELRTASHSFLGY